MNGKVNCMSKFLIALLSIYSLISAQVPLKVDKVYINMEEAISLALSQNNQVKASEFAMRKANWDKKQAWTQLFPTVTLNSRYMWIDDSTFALRDFSRYFQDPNSPFDIPQTVFQESYYTSIDLSLPVFNGNILNGLFIADAAEDASIQLNESARRNIVFLVTQAYLNVLNLSEVLEIQNEYLNLSKLNFEKAERLHNAGRYSISEVLRWKVELQQQKSIVVTSESQLRTSKTLLKRYTNIEMKNEIEIENRIPEILLVESENLTNMPNENILKMIQLSDEKLIEVNAALAAAKSNEKISKYFYHNSYSSFMPNINLTYSHAWRENNTIELDDYSPKTLMVNLSMPLFTSFQNFTAVKSSYYDYKTNQEKFYDQLQNTRLVLIESVNKIINLKAQKELSETNINFNEKNYRIVEQQKEKGLVSNLDFIDAKLNLQKSKLDNINIYYEFITGMVELYYLLGKMEKIIEKY